MDIRTSAAVAGLYLFGFVAVMLVAVAFFLGEPREWRPEAEASPATPHSPPSAKMASAANAARYYQASLQKAQQTIRELEAAVVNAESTAAARARALAEQRAQSESLRQELDQSFALILQLLSEEGGRPVSTAAVTDDVAEPAALDREQLLAALQRADEREVEREVQLEQTQAAWKRAETSLARLREQSEVDLAMLLAEKKAIETEAVRMLAAGGPVVVALLTERLADERLEVRRWAVRTLAGCGPLSSETITAMRRLLSDPDASVREEARRALGALNDGSID